MGLLGRVRRLKPNELGGLAWEALVVQGWFTKGERSR